MAGVLDVGGIAIPEATTDVNGVVFRAELAVVVGGGFALVAEFALVRLAVVVVAAVDEELLLPELGPRAPEFDRFI